MRPQKPRRAAVLAIGATVASTLFVLSPAATAVAAPDADPAAPSASRLIVNYRTNATEKVSDGAAARDAEGKGRQAGRPVTMQRRLATGGVLVDLGGVVRGADLDAVIRQFSADPDVEKVEMDRLLTPLAIPNDPMYPKQWDLFEKTAGLNVPTAWHTATGKGVTVAVLDTGSTKHSDLDANLLPGYDFVSDAMRARDGDGWDADATDEGDWTVDWNPCFAERAPSTWHGTHVSGTIAAVAGNNTGVAGVAHGAKVLPVRVLAWCGATMADVTDAIVWASGGVVDGVPANKTPADVINLSLGGYGHCQDTFQAAINFAVGRGTTVVVAAGNAGEAASTAMPGNCANVITVAASDRAGNRAFYSNYGDPVDITAPGGETRRALNAGSVATPQNGILSTVNAGATTPGKGSYQPKMGTSMAAPHIAALAALILEKHPDLTPAQVRPPSRRALARCREPAKAVAARVWPTREKHSTCCAEQDGTPVRIP